MRSLRESVEIAPKPSKKGRSLKGGTGHPPYMTTSEPIKVLHAPQLTVSVSEPSVSERKVSQCLREIA